MNIQWSVGCPKFRIIRGTLNFTITSFSLKFEHEEYESVNSRVP